VLQSQPGFMTLPPGNTQGKIEASGKPDRWDGCTRAPCTRGSGFGPDLYTGSEEQGRTNRNGSAQTMAQGFKERATKGGTPKRLWPSTDNTQIEAPTWARLRLLFTQQLSAVHSKLVLSLDQMATKSDEMGSMLATQLEKLKDLKVQVRSRRKQQGHPGARRAAERAREEWRQAYTLGLQLVMAKNLNVSVDAAWTPPPSPTPSTRR
jgi:hypothetical protein